MMRSVSGTARVVLNGACALLLVGAVTSVGPALAAGVRICLEAESGEFTKPMTLYKARDLSGGAAIEVPEGVNPEVKEGEEPPELSGECTIKFTVPKEGTYTLWGRCWWTDGCGNSFAISLDGGRRATLVSGNYKRWHWVRGPVVRLTAGTHELKIYNTEDGARLDQVFLTSDSGRIPVGKEKVTPAYLVKPKK
ncbi:MAG: hypothetical protein GX774_15385 [Armatimonadetes bacterium]|nr:hypothetical protein [Armatimonadota bacterium]